MNKRHEQILLLDWDTFRYELAPEERQRPLQPEERLFLAVIMQAVDDATSPTPSIARDQARGVIFTSSATPLKDMCDLLDINYDYFKRAVTTLIKEGRTVRRADTSGA
jgi:hypothetical protein